METHKDMKNQLKELKPILGSKNSLKKPKRSPMGWKEDGVDHINIWDRGNTTLGKFLSHNAKTPFTHNIFRKFCSMDSFWKYIQSEERDDRLRVMSGVTLRAFSKQLTMLRINNFKAIILDSEWQKLKQYPDKVKIMRESTLPFDFYYINKKSGIRIRPTYFNWLIAGINEIRTALIENREPDFTFLKDKPAAGIYDYVLNTKVDKPLDANLIALEEYLSKDLASNLGE